MKNTIKKTKLNYTLQISLMFMLGILLSVSPANAATYTVTNQNDSGPGSLRVAILEANGSSTDDIIQFNVSLNNKKISLTSGELTIADNGRLTINGLGAERLSISGNWTVTSNSTSRVFFIGANARVIINDIKITEGSGNGAFSNLGGGGIFNSGDLTLNNVNVIGNYTLAKGGHIYNKGILTLINTNVEISVAQNEGGGIYNDGTITLTDSVVKEGHSISGFGGGIYNEYDRTITLNNSFVQNNKSDNSDAGGGIFNNGTLNLNNSTVGGNAGSICGGIYNYFGILTLTNSTVSGNSNSNVGGGIYNNSGRVTLTNSTVSGNWNTAGGGGMFNSGIMMLSNSTVSGNATGQNGGGIHNHTGTLTLNNSTVNDNSAVQNGGGIYNSFGTLTANNSIIANSTTGGDCFRASGTLNARYSLIEDGLNCVNAANETNLTGDPMLGSLRYNGGLTFTHALLTGSPVINAGSNSLTPAEVTTDQRGLNFPRTNGASVDIGAFESTPAIFLIVTKVTDTNDGNCDALDCSLREAISAANEAAFTDVTIVFASPLAFSPQTITLIHGELNIANIHNLTINGLGANRLSISGNNQNRVFFISPNANATLNGMTITDGNASEAITGGGGGIRNHGYSLTINNSTISNNSALSSSGGSNTGGGIFNHSRLTITNSTISGNSAFLHGGGIQNVNEIWLTNCTISGNSAQDGGGIYNEQRSSVTLTNTTISGNSATTGHGVRGGGIKNYYGFVTVNNTIIANSVVGSDCDSQGPHLMADHSLIEDGTCAITANTNGNRVGDPNLGPLQNNGGRTLTYALLPGSPAINAGNNLLIASLATTDQRGANRIIDTNVDMGSFESYQPTAASASVSGRIINANGARISRAIVTATNINGGVRTAVSNSFGYFRFEDIPIGETYIFTVKHKQYSFNSQVITIMDAVENLDFTASEKL